MVRITIHIVTGDATPYVPGVRIRKYASLLVERNEKI
jgi:hypothetical protein